MLNETSQNYSQQRSINARFHFTVQIEASVAGAANDRLAQSLEVPTLSQDLSGSLSENGFSVDEFMVKEIINPVCGKRKLDDVGARSLGTLL